MASTSAAAPQSSTERETGPASGLRKFFALELLDNRYAALHGLRVLAIVSVIQFHVTWIYMGELGIMLDPRFFTASTTVFFGMDLFFVLSGFLIGSILLHSIETVGDQQIRRFYLRRILRTFPSYYVTLTVLVLAFGLTAMQRQHLRWEYVYLTNFFSLERPSVVMFWGWSLALEEQFYLTVPILFLVLRALRSDRARIVLLVALWLAALVVRIVIYVRGRPWDDFVLYGALYFRTHTRFDTLVAGLLLALVHRRWKRELTAWLATPLHRAMIAIPSLGCLWLLIEPSMFGHQWLQWVHVFAWGTVTTLMYFGFLLLLLHGEGAIVRFLSAPIFRRVATLGYGVYLVHIPLIDHVVAPIAGRLARRSASMMWVWPASLVAVTLLSLGLAYLMHVLIEKPSLYVRQRLAE